MYRLAAPFSRSKTLKIKIRDLLTNVIQKALTAEMTDEYNPNRIGPIQLSRKTMPLTGRPYSHQTNGWHICRDFHRTCIQGAGLKAYPRGTVGNIVRPNSRLTHADVQQLRAAFNDDDELLFAISTLANTCIAGAIWDGMWGKLNPTRDPQISPIPVLTFNGSPLTFAITPHIQIKIRRGRGGRPEVDCIQQWTREDVFGMVTGHGTVHVKDLGVDQVTYRVHLVLHSGANSITINTRPSWARAWFTKHGCSLFSSSASPDDMVELIDDDFIQ